MEKLFQIIKTVQILGPSFCSTSDAKNLLTHSPKKK